MAQINVSVEDRVLAALDRVAQTKSLSRPELLRRVIQELIEAHDAGRMVFQKEAAPRLDTTVSFLVHELRDLVVELDRAQNENARLFGKLVADWNGGEAASQRAHENIANQTSPGKSATTPSCSPPGVRCAARAMPPRRRR